MLITSGFVDRDIKPGKFLCDINKNLVKVDYAERWKKIHVTEILQNDNTEVEKELELV